MADGLRRLSEYGETQGINIIVENHGGLSSNGTWLAGVMRMVAHPRCGTLPDFGNFYEYDRYEGVKDMMPFAVRSEVGRAVLGRKCVGPA